jgi:hypothetical protein
MHEPLASCYVVIFKTRSLIYGQAGLDLNPSGYTSHIAGIASACHHTQLLLVEMGLVNFCLGWP